MTERDAEPATADRLRADIDRGMTGEKVAAVDPAAAPMGTDAEAGGAPPTRAERALEQRSRQKPPQRTPAQTDGRGWIWAVCLFVVALLVVAVVISV